MSWNLCICPWQEFIGIYEVDDVEIADNKYSSTIHLINVNHYYVGFFFCVANNTQFDYDYSFKFITTERYRLLSMLSVMYVYVNGKIPKSYGR